MKRAKSGREDTVMHANRRHTIAAVVASTRVRRRMKSGQPTRRCSGRQASRRAGVKQPPPWPRPGHDRPTTIESTDVESLSMLACLLRRGDGDQMREGSDDTKMAEYENGFAAFSSHPQQQWALLTCFDD